MRMSSDLEGWSVRLAVSIILNERVYGYYYTKENGQRGYVKVFHPYIVPSQEGLGAVIVSCFIMLFSLRSQLFWLPSSLVIMFAFLN